MPGAHLVRDPLDARYTYVQSSSIQGAGEGLFAKKNIEAQTIVSVYSGLTMSKEQFLAETNLRQCKNSLNLVAPNAIGLDPDQVPILSMILEMIIMSALVTNKKLAPPPS